MNFDEARLLFNASRIRELAEHSDGSRFLMLRALSRRQHLELLFDAAAVDPGSLSASELLRRAFDTNSINDDLIREVALKIYEHERELRRNREQELIAQLYHLTVFDWGGLHQNSLEKTIVDNYVKKIQNFDQLSISIENELHHSMRGYVLCSWYNHWTTIIIEDIFGDHPAVLPAVSSVKNIDFFLQGVPFDLKVTYLPEGYVGAQRKEHGLRPELTLLGRWARSANVPFDKALKGNRLLQDLWNKISDHPASDSRQLLMDLIGFRVEVVQEAQSDPSNLIRWLYENQGARRFDASNRLFLVLVDSPNFFDSWKLKRAKPLLESVVTGYLDNMASSPGRSVQFNWNGVNHEVVADAIVVTKPAVYGALDRPLGQ